MDPRSTTKGVRGRRFGPASWRGGGWSAAGLLLMLALVGSSLVGPGGFDVRDVWSVLAAHAVGRGTDDRLAEAILWDLRFPRILLAGLVGAALGAAGAVTQGLFRNPLAEPGVLGVSMGAAAAVVLSFLFGLDESALWATPAVAAAGAAGVLLLLFVLAGRTESVAVLLLMGVALSAVLGAAMTFFLALTLGQWDLAQKVMAWLMGSFDGRGWNYLRWGAAPLLLSLLGMAALHRPLDLLRLGEDTAATLGVHRGRLRLVAAVFVALASGGATAMVGVIGFVGLVVPHVARAFVPARHAQLIPASMVLGALMMVGFDTLGRAMSPWHVPPGALASLVGGIFVIVLLRRRGLRVE